LSNYTAAKILIAQFSGQENVIGVPRAFCRFMGDLEGGVFLSQVIFWSDKGRGEPGWFYKSFQEWQDELLLSRYKVGQFTERLAELGVLETKLKRANGAPTVHYKFDFEKFAELFCKFLQMEPSTKATDSAAASQARFEHGQCGGPQDWRKL